MFFDSLEDIPKIAENAGFSIFIFPLDLVKFPEFGKKYVKTTGATFLKFPEDTFFLQPNERNTITVDMMRELSDQTVKKQTSPRFLVVRSAERLNPAAENACLKLLEEPKENYHLVFLASDLSGFLPTILSRASIYIYRLENPLDRPPATDEKITELAKRLITVSPRTLPSLVEALSDKKNKHVREDALAVVATAIELIYKSYFKTGNEKLLKKLPNLLKLYDNLKGNGHLKLQLWANLC